MEEAEAPAGEETSAGDAPAAPENEAQPAPPEPSTGTQAPAREAEAPATSPTQGAESPKPPAEEPRIMPSARRKMKQEGVAPEDVQPTGPGGRVLKEDVQTFMERRQPQPSPPPEPRGEKLVRMSPIRRTIASRLVEAQHTAALLTTFNEVDMSACKQMRADMQETFQERYGVKLGFMSFFVRACCHALIEFPQVNAQIREEDIVYFNYADIGIAVGSGKGLVVPVLRDAERLSLAQIERTIADFAARAKENRIKMEELQGGTFTISNGGVYGSMLSTPIINPPQSGVLGMHNIVDRPVAVEGQVVIRPMMYLALTYDHRIVDGREAVQFLKAIKERIEKPALLLDF
jgi:2-oxoglutarate dehydrogenase E2 component (dihydrolipoamide succinyltransferase)